MEIKTERLSLRELREADWKDMKNLFTDFNHSPYAIYDRPLPETDEEVRDLTRQFAGSRLFFTISLSGRIIGYIGFYKVKDAYDLGYCFHSSCHGNGYAYESVKDLLNYLVRKYQIRKITAGTALDNAPSCSLLKKLGFICVSTEPLSFDGKFYFQSGNFVLESDGIQKMKEKNCQEV